MQARKIPKNYLVVTGGFASQKNDKMRGFESLLEKDHLLLLEFDDSVTSFDVQPVRIPVPGVRNGYVPDVLVHYKTNSDPPPRSQLIEVKTLEDLERNKQKYAPKFAAATQFAQARGWEFVIRDETQIRTSRLSNLKFLREYRNSTPTEQEVAQVLRCFTVVNSSSTLLNSLAASEEEKLRWLPVIWSMLLTKQLVTNLEVPFTGDVPLWLPESKE
ncbi:MULTISPECIES: TnsA endonuclease N-terminal domain-containing protein [unclassified Polaromonas]|uniref:TnsA endonuclease N-terminal domain-containing protein n=1 Tax=unclassified Polaromonas TaxID=2638319 RepID=UPI000F090E36|nr:MULTISPECIES: TnsA endonuclease N-terminal domain-containing protein [unclassified Polaromonas]AYQ27486.1 heteromeric transposase endonuclease subunit TnsA [Polaromonas sp. SP1]QGJ17673.1 heteromeric transposase endonuclease subunit TnsA [Polaromonas sp. Pch-P]